MPIELIRHNEGCSVEHVYCNRDLEEEMKVFPEYNEEFLSSFEKNGTLDKIKEDYEKNESDEVKIALIDEIRYNESIILDLVYMCSYMLDTYENLINDILCYNQFDKDSDEMSWINEALSTCMNICRVRLKNESKIIDEYGEIISENCKDTLLSLDIWQKNNW